jgi:hypothetical protein
MPKSKYNDYKLLEDELLLIVNKIGRMPSTTYLKTIGKGDLLHGIRIHGGIRVVSDKIGYPTKTTYKTLSGDIVRSSYEMIVANFLYLNNIQYDYEPKISLGRQLKADFKIGEIYIEVWGMMGRDAYRSRRVMKEKVYNDNNLKLISLEVNDFKLNIEEINEILIHHMKLNNIKVNDFYKKVDDILYSEHFQLTYKHFVSEIEDYCSRNNLKTLRSEKWWKENGFGKHMNFLSNNKIKLRDVAKDLGLTPHTTSWTLDKLKIELNPICETLGRFPTPSDLKNTGRYKILNTINKYGGFVIVSELMGYIKNENSLLRSEWKNNIEKWKDKEYVVSILKSKYDTYMPSANDLTSDGNSDLLNAIILFHGGLSSVAIYTGLKHTSKRKWYTYDQLEQELSVICGDLGKFPTQDDLVSIGRLELSYPINKYGGYGTVAEKMGYKRKLRQKGEWKSFEKVKSELLIICENIQRFPTQKDFKDIHREDLRKAIYRYHGGVKTVKTILGFP